MITQWDGRCSFCKLTIPAGTDVHYDAQSKVVAHWDCYDNPKPGPDAYRLADELGYREIGWDAIFKVLEGK